MINDDALVAHLARAVQDLAQVRWPWLLAGLVLQTLSLGLRATAWRNIIAAAYPDRRVPRLGIGAAYVLGVAANGVFPAKVGEVAKVAVARLQVERSETSALVASLGVLSGFDLLVGTVITLAVVLSGVVPGLAPSAMLSAPQWALPGLAAALLVVLVASRSRWGRAGLRRLMVGVSSSLAIVRTPRAYLTRVAIPQTLAWFCRIGVAASLLAAFGLHPSIASAAVIVVAGGLAGLLPGTPGGLGPQQILLVYALGATAAADKIVAFSVGMQLSVMALQLVLGTAALMIAVRIAHPLRAFRTASALVRPPT